jgi:hypothetical protein
MDLLSQSQPYRPIGDLVLCESELWGLDESGFLVRFDPQSGEVIGTVPLERSGLFAGLAVATEVSDAGFTNHRERRSLLSVVPNPTSTQVGISLTQDTASACELLIVDASGRMVWRGTFSSDTVAGRDQFLHWDLKSNRGMQVPSGPYFLSLMRNGQLLDASTIRVLR